MSNRINGFIVVLDKDYKDEDVEATISAIKQIKGVIAVKPNIVSANDHILREKIKFDICRKIENLAIEIYRGE